MCLPPTTVELVYTQAQASASARPTQVTHSTQFAVDGDEDPAASFAAAAAALGATSLKAGFL